jgi:hypothetical protein
MHKDKSILEKRARQKYISYGLSSKLYFDNPGSPLNSSYCGSMLCCDKLLQMGQKIQTKYCNQRWCLVCNRIRAARLISGYLSQIQTFKDPYFVTLTKETVYACDLPDSMALMAAEWRKIADMGRKSRIDFKGIRKAECTIRPGGKYHFHFHLAVEGKENAEWLISRWIKQMKGKANPRAQDMRIANDNSLKELFKYFTKLTTKNPDGKKVIIDTRRMDVIFQAMKRKRVFQPFGGLRIVLEDIQEIIGEEYEHLEHGFHVWKWYEEDWINELGKCLTGHQSNEKFTELLEGSTNTGPLFVAYDTPSAPPFIHPI